MPLGISVCLTNNHDISAAKNIYDCFIIYSNSYICLKLFAINSLRPRRNRRHFANDIFKHIFLYENIWISIEISLKFVSKVPINNIPALAQIMAWRRLGDKPLSEPMLVRLPTRICVTRPQWVNCYLMPAILLARHSDCQYVAQFCGISFAI